MMPAHGLGPSLLWAVAGLLAAALALAGGLALAQRRRLQAIAAAVEAHARGEPLALPPTNRGTIGRLARALAALAAASERRLVLLQHAAERERSFLAAIQSTGYAFFTTRLDGIITAWNPGAEHLFGYSADEAIGRNAAIIVPPERMDEVRRNFARLRRHEQIDNFETVRRSKDGRPVHLAMSISPICDETGALAGVSVLARDVAAQKLAEELFRLAVEACPSGMVMTEASGTIVMVNGATERLFGYAREELVGQSIDLLLPEPVREQHAAHRARYAARPDSRTMGGGRDLRGRRKDGSEFSVEVALNPVPTRDGLLILGAVQDVSERRRTERMKDEFVSTVSHELRTPMTSIAGSLALLVGGAAGPLPEPIHRLLSIAQKNSERLVRLINDILDIEKIESGAVVFDIKREDAMRLVQQAIEANRAFAESHDVTVRLATGAPIDVAVDPDRFVQVITNLLSNAVKFSPAGAEVEVSLDAEEERARVSVRDHGPGIPAHFRPRLFDKFAQADATDDRKRGGTGLGLSIVKQIVIRLGGEVTFADAPGGGTVFHVAVPRWSAQAARAQEPARSERPCVLLCEDDEVTARSLGGRIAAAGFSVVTVATANEALGQAMHHGFAAILVDLQLPDTDGITLIQALRALPAHQNTPIIVVSADPSAGRNDLRAPSLDVLDWLEKPVDIRHLIEVLDRPIVRGTRARPRVLHVDDDPAVLGLVAQALDATADVVSVDSVEGARRSLATYRFDLVVLDVALAAGSGLDLLPDLRDANGDAIPVIVFSAQGANRACAERVQQVLTKSRASIDQLISMLMKGGVRRRAELRDKEVA